MQRFDTVIISDLHLGACNSRAPEILNFLHRLRCDRLILAGDIFDNPWLRGLSPLHIEILAELRQLSRECEVIWIGGNHDPSPEFCDTVLSVELRDEYVLLAGEKRYLVCHGHAWDKAMTLPSVIVEAADWVYRCAQRLDPTHRLARYLKRKSKWFCGVVHAIRRRALWAARRRGLDGVIVGHSHVASEFHWRDMHYVNCGCWTERPAGFVGVRGDQVRQYAWEPVTARELAPCAAPNSRSVALTATLAEWRPVLGALGWEHPPKATTAEPASVASSAAS